MLPYSILHYFGKKPAKAVKRIMLLVFLRLSDNTNLIPQEGFSLTIRAVTDTQKVHSVP